MASRGNGRFTPEYLAYLQSYEWKVVRLRKLESVNYRCERCGKPATQAHHLNYEALDFEGWGKETNDDLLALCKDCHQQVHQEISADREAEFECRRFYAWATKVYGEYWADSPGYEVAREAFDEWLEEKARA